MLNIFKANWFLIAIFGMLSFAGMALTLKKLTYTVSTPVILFYLFICTSVFYGAYNVQKTMSLKITWGSFSLIVLAAVFAFLGNLCDVEALRLAPNVGYASAIKAGQIIVITAAAYFMFHDQKISATGIVGVLMILGGLVLLAMQKN